MGNVLFRTMHKNKIFYFEERDIPVSGTPQTHIKNVKESWEHRCLPCESSKRGMVTDECSMNRIFVVLLGVSLILASGAIFAYENLTSSLPVLGSGNGQSTDGDYVAFLAFALGGGGVLILLFAFLQWFGKWGPKHGIMVKRRTSHS